MDVAPIPDAATAALYHGPLDEFVGRRKALVTQLRRDDPQAAAAAAKLHKPSATAWAIDQLAVEAPELLAELLAAGADAVDAQQAAVGGKEGGPSLGDATARVHHAVEAAVRAATAVLDRAGHAANEQSARRLRMTLQAAAAGGRVERAALWRGTLDRDLDSAGFGLPEDGEEDPPELAAAIESRRVRTPRQHRGGIRAAASSRDLVAVRVAERAATEQRRLAERARASAAAKRQHAERLATQLAVAQEDAVAAEAAAQVAEAAAAAARTRLEAESRAAGATR